MTALVDFVTRICWCGAGLCAYLALFLLLHGWCWNEARTQHRRDAATLLLGSPSTIPSAAQTRLDRSDIPSVVGEGVPQRHGLTETPHPVCSQQSWFAPVGLTNC